MLAGLPVYGLALTGLGEGLGLPSPESWWPIAVYAASATLCVVGRMAVSPADERLPWTVLTLALVSSTAGWTTWVLLFEGDPQPAHPSSSDAFWIASMPLLYVGMVILIGRERPDLPRRSWLDGIVAACALGAIAAQITLPASSSGAGDFVARATLLVYPAGSIFLIALLGLICVFRRWRPGPRWSLFALGVVSDGLASSLWAYGVSDGSWTSGRVPDVLFAISLTAFAGAAWVPSGIRGRRPAGGRVTLVPAGFALLAIGLLAYGNQSQPLVLPALILAVAATVAGMVRWAIAVRQETAVSLLDRLVHTDDLLSIPNRRSLLRTLDGLAGRSRSHPFALVVLDLDSFKDLNAALGHHAGDEVLHAVSDRLARALPSPSTFARVAGDQFAVVIPDCVGLQAVEATTAMLRVLGEPFRHEDIDLALEASVGIALWPEHAQTGSELLRSAETAMFEAKYDHGGGSWRIYTPEADRRTREGLGRLSYVRTAIEEGRLVVHYQPQIDLRTGDVVGAEALARLQDPERGMLYPGQFLPAVESSGLMRSLLLAVLDAAVAECRGWLAAGGPPRVSVNLSARNLLDERLPDDVAEILERHKLDRHRLCLEVTEHGMMLDRARAERMLGVLRSTGVQVSVDDFGVGYSSLARVRHLPVDEIKIDRSFVAAMGSSRPDAVIVRSAVDLAHALGVRIVAEGVEDEGTAELLREQGCELAQGFHFGRPGSAAELVVALSGCSS